MHYLKHTLFLVIFFFLISTICTAEMRNYMPMYGGEAPPLKETSLKLEYMHIGTSEEIGDYIANKAWNYIAQQNWKKAMEQFNEAWVFDSKNPKIYWGFGTALGMQGKYSEAIKFFTKADKMLPDNAGLLTDIGYAHIGQAIQYSDTEKVKPQLNKAIEFFKKALASDETCEPALSNWAIALYYMQDYSGAWKMIEKAKKLGGNFIDESFLKALKKKMPQVK